MTALANKQFIYLLALSLLLQKNNKLCVIPAGPSLF